jgi:hypothetical protein
MDVDVQLLERQEISLPAKQLLQEMPYAEY